MLLRDAFPGWIGWTWVWGRRIKLEPLRVAWRSDWVRHLGCAAAPGVRVVRVPRLVFVRRRKVRGRTGHDVMIEPAIIGHVIKRRPRKRLCYLDLIYPVVGIQYG